MRPSQPAEWGREYEVVPEEDVGWRREWRERVRARAKAGPGSPARLLPALAPSPGWLRAEDDLTDHDRMMRAFADRLRAELTRLSGALGALDVVLEEARAKLGGHDPADPILREAVERMRADLRDVSDGARTFLGELDLTGQDATTAEKLRALLVRSD